MSRVGFFRRFALQDGWTMILNGLVLFVVVFYVYPLKFLSTLMFAGLVDEPGEATIRTGDIPLLLAIYGCGFAAIFVLYAALYLYPSMTTMTSDVHVSDREFGLRGKFVTTRSWCATDESI